MDITSVKKFVKNYQNPNFKSKNLDDRQSRLKDIKKNSFKCQRDLKKDRTMLEKTEKSLLIQLKQFASKGDLPKAKMIANQIALYRSISDKNFERSVMIDLQSQLMFSNHKIYQAQTESIKGLTYANIRQFEDVLFQKDVKYNHLVGMHEDIESMMNQNMSDIYDSFQESLPKPALLDLEVSAIMRQALDPVHLGSKYMSRPTNQEPLPEVEIQLHVRVHQSKEYNIKKPNPHSKSDGATLNISTLDISVDMLKRQISQDFFAIKQLGLETSNPAYNAILSNVKPFKIGKLVESQEGKTRFVAFDFTCSLQNLGLEDGDTVWISIME